MSINILFIALKVNSKHFKSYIYTLNQSGNFDSKKHCPQGFVLKKGILMIDSVF